MPYLTASVGRSGANRPHDVATIGTNLTGNGGADKAVEWLGGKAKVRKDVPKAKTEDESGEAGGASPQDNEKSDKDAGKGDTSAEDGTVELECKKGDTASDEKIKAEYAEVAEQEGGKLYTHYKQFTNLDIDRATARALARDEFPNVLSRIRRSGLYPDFETAPFEAQVVVMDIAFNVKPKSFPGYVKTAKSFVRRDWERMNKEQKDGRDSNKKRMGIIKSLLDKPKDQQTFFIKLDAERGKGVKIDSLD
jgi:hypothetical protein